MAIELWRAVPEGAHEILPDRKCPRCYSERTHRSRVRGPFEDLMKSVTPLRPFSCSGCQWRGWRVPVASTGPSVTLPPVPVNRRRTARADKRHAQHQSGMDIFRSRQRVQVLLAAVFALIVVYLYFF